MLTHRPHGVPTKEGATTASQPPLTAGFGRAAASGGDDVACKRALVGNSLNDE